MFVADGVTLQDIADQLQQVGVTTLPAYVADVNTRVHAQAYNRIVSILAARGFLLAQILACDMGESWERSLTCFFALTALTRIAQVPQAVLDSLDVREEIGAAELTSAGVWTIPGGTAGQIGTGQMDAGSSWEGDGRGGDGRYGGWGECL